MSEQIEGGLPAESPTRASPLGRTMVDALELSDAERQLVTWMLRQGEVSLRDIVAGLGQDGEAVRGLLASLVEQGFVRERAGADGAYFRVHLAPSRPRRVPGKLWRVLDEKLAE